MPYANLKQKRFFLLVKGVQTGKISPKKVGDKVSKAAKSMSSNDVDDFIKKKKVEKPKLKEIVDILKNINKESTISPVEPMHLEEEHDDLNTERNPISKTFQQKGSLDQYIQRFTGLEFKSKELESIINYTESKPTKQDKFSVRYEKSDEFGNTTITVIKKLREENNLVFTIFQSTSHQAKDDKTVGNNEDTIVISKSNSFREEIEGGNILSDILRKLDV